MDESKVEVLMLSFFAGIILCLGALIGFGINESIWRDATVKHGAAEYDSQSGAWKWKEPKPQEPKGEE